MVYLTKENILKFTIFVGSTIMFICQFYTSLCHLINPDLIDTTEIKSRDDITPPLITICPTNQLNETKLKEMGYSSWGVSYDQFNFFSGQLGIENGTQITWGTHENKSFEKYLEQFLATPIQTSKHWVVVTLKTEKRLIRKVLGDKLRKQFYIGFWGYCWDLVDYDPRSILTISNKLNQKFEVFISDAEKKTFYSIDTYSQFGSKIVASDEGQVSYQIKIQKYSDIDPRFEGSCVVYDKNEYEKCVDEQVESLVTPILGCNPPWLSEKNLCTEVINIYDVLKKSLWGESMFPIVYNYESKLEKNCQKSCHRTEYQSRIKQTFSLNPYLVGINFDTEVPFTRKVVTYDFSNFLVDLGSSLGLWFGLSVFGLTDLAIQIVVSLKNLKTYCFDRNQNCN